jgi:HAD superfamily hydrolase (TIGR01549 family)
VEILFSESGVFGMTLKAVFFDMGGTIETFGWTPGLRIRETAGIRQRLEQAGISLGLSDQQLYETISAGLAEYHRVSLQNMDELPPWRVWNEFILPGYPVDREKLSAIAEDLTFFIETHYYERTLRPEVPAVLEAIRRMGLKLGIISNVNSLGQVPTNLDIYNIRQFFDPIVLSSAYGRRKPDPAIFHYAARLAGVPTSQCAYIGDRIARDIVGARKAGYRLAVQINHDYDHGEADDGAEPDAVIDQMTDLVDILRSEIASSDSTWILAPAFHNQVKALLFDAGDILYQRPHPDRNLRAFLSELGLDSILAPQAAIQEIKDHAFDGTLSQTQYRQAFLQLYGISTPDLLRRGCLAMEADDYEIEFFEGVPETVLALKEKGFLLAIVTDTANPIHAKLDWFERGGFGHVWDSIISSQEIGVKKPDPRMYQAALQQLGLTPSQAVFVGHNPAELQGAREVGMQTVAFNYSQAARADFYLSKFTDLLMVPVISC